MTTVEMPVEGARAERMDRLDRDRIRCSGLQFLNDAFVKSAKQGLSVLGFRDLLEQAQQGRSFARSGHGVDLQGLTGFELAERLEDRLLLWGGRRGGHAVSITDGRHWGWPINTVVPRERNSLLTGYPVEEVSICSDLLHQLSL